MSDSENPAGPGGGPRYLQSSARPADLQLSVVASPRATATSATVINERDRPDDLFSNRYARNGVSPVPHMVLALVAIAVTSWALRWARWTPDAPGRPHTSEWWSNLAALLVPSEGFGPMAYSNGRMWVALAMLVGTAILVTIWMGRVGSNLRQGQAPFGSFIPLVTFPAWWLLPITINGTADGTRSRSDLLVRFLVAFGILFAQFLLLRWPVLNRIWRAGRLPYDMASMLLWLPMMVPWAMIFASSAWTLLVVGEDGVRSDSSWVPTPAMYDWSMWLTRATGIAIIVLLVVVTARQHIGLRQDQLDDQAARER